MNIIQPVMHGREFPQALAEPAHVQADGKTGVLERVLVNFSLPPPP